MDNTDLNQLTILIADIRNQLENVEAWLLFGRIEEAIIKSKCLIDVADELKILINKQDITSWLNS